MKRGPLPFLWYLDKGGYSGWSTLANDVALQKHSLKFDPATAQAVLAHFRSKLEKQTFSLIPQTDAIIEKEISALDHFVFYPLQVNNDEVMKLADCPQFELIRKAGELADKSGRHLVIKRHPLCVSETVTAALDSIIESPFVHLSTGPVVELIKRASAVMLTNSSVGVQALILNVPVFSFGSSEYAHMTTRLFDTSGVERVFFDLPARPHDAFAGGIAYLLSEYLVDMKDPARITERIDTHMEECRRLASISDIPTTPKAVSEGDLRDLTLKRALERESDELLDFVLMVYPKLVGNQKERVARMLARLAWSGISTERIIMQTDEGVAHRCLTYLEKNGDVDMLIRVARARLKSDSNDWRADYMLAKAYYAQNKDQAGLNAAREAAEIDGAPPSVTLYYARRLWNTLKAPNDTIVSLVRDALQVDPSNAVANWLQARISLGDGKIETAHYHIEAALAAAPENKTYQKLLAKINETNTMNKIA